jgi:Protein of unknown function (DUF669)
MARLDAAFDAHEVEPLKPFEVLPAGTYRAQIVESEMRVTRDGMGQFLWLMLDILEGPHQGRKVFDQLNLVNASQRTVEIAKRTLSAICHATGRMEIADSEALHLIPMTISVTVEPPKNGYGERNRIRYVSPKKDAAPTPRAQQPAATAASAPTTAAQPQGVTPWRRNV